MEQPGVGLESPSYVQKRLVLGRQQKRVRDFCAAKGLPRMPEREKAYGVAKQPRALTGKAWNASSRAEYLKSSKYGKTDRFAVKGANANLNNKQVQAIDRLASKYPLVDETLSKRGLAISTAATKGVAYTMRAGGEWRIVFDSTVFASKSSYMDNVWGDISSGYLMPARKSDSVNYVVAHEIGHILQKSMAEKRYGAGFTNVEYIEFAAEYQDRIVARAVKSKRNKSDYVSGYAKDNPRDFFAECFANANCGKPNAYGKALMELLREDGVLC
jgi:hypothetical protein